MLRCVNPLFLLPALIAGFGLLLAGRVTAQTFTTLHSFTATSGSYPGIGTNSDGAHPEAGLILSGNALYGTTFYGGISGRGTLFKINTDGSGFTNLHIFTATSDYLGIGTNSDGAQPFAGLILSGSTLYGTTYYGGTSGNGTVFKVNTDGTSFTNLHSFTASVANRNSDGAQPIAGLILSGNTLYGTAVSGGSSGKGTVFAVNTDGTGFTNLHSFSDTSWPSYTNSDGAQPYAGLVLSGNTLYGTADQGGSWGFGTVFKVNTNGTGFTNLHSFGGVDDGVNPYAGLILSGNSLYGTELYGGNSGNGTVFKVNTDGTGFTNLYSFTELDPTVSTNSDGANPQAGLILSGNILYGTARYGGSSGVGTVFAIKTDGTGFTNLYSFTAKSTNSSGIYTNSDGAGSVGGLILSGNTLYGTAEQGGGSGKGTVFGLSFAPQLTIVPFGAVVILTWSTNYAGFDYGGFALQSTTNLVSPTVWTNVSPGPVVVNGQYAVTNPISGTQQFYRLSQ